MKGILAKKIMMHQLFTSNGEVVPVTFLEVIPNFVTQVKTLAKDNYQALQLATGFKKSKNICKPLSGHLEKTKGAKNSYLLQEFTNMTGFKQGDKVSLAIFKEGQYVDVQAISKGKGTSGVIKLHNFSRGPMTHGSKHHRAPGSVGISRPDKVWKGQPLPGRKGNKKTTIQNLQIIKIDLVNHLLILKGSIPGNNKSFCKVTSSLKRTTLGKVLPLVDYLALSKKTPLSPTLKSENTNR